jgi:hypothetical protein
MDISPSFPLYIARRSRFAKRFFETAPTTPKEPLHQKSRSRSCFERSRSPSEHTLDGVILSSWPKGGIRRSKRCSRGEVRSAKIGIGLMSER